MSIIPQASKNYVGFDPRSITGCQIWLDAADASTFTLSGSNVTQWRDKSGNGYNATQGTAANGPTYSNSMLVFTSASQQWMALNQTFGNLLLNNASFHVFIVAYGSGFGFITGQTSALGQNLFLGYNFMDNYADPLFLSGTPAVAASVNSISSFEYTGSSGTTARLYQNGTNYASAVKTLTLTAFSGPQIGRRYTSTYHDHNFCEIVAYTGIILSTSQRQQIEGYLANKWGLTSSLPATHPYKRIPIVTRPFQPIDISGCALWLDAADPSTITVSGTNVTAVRDKSGNGVVLSNATGFSYPNNTFNGTYPSFYNASVSGTAKLGVNASFSISAPFTVFFVAQRTATVGLSAGFLIDNTTGSGSRVYVWDPGASNLYTTTPAQTNAPSSTASVISTELSASYYFYQNGTAATVTANAASSSQSGLTVGNAWSLNASWGGHICEMIFYSGSVSASQRQQVEGYLANKWGLRSSLPSTHPFKLYPAITALFTPLQISGCRLWLDAADGSTLTLSGSNVTQWNDKSGNGFNATGGGNPVYNSTLSRIQFNGTSSYFSNLTYSLTLGSRTMFVIMSENSRNITGGVIVQVPNPTSGTDYIATSGCTFETTDGMTSGGGYVGGTPGYKNTFGNATLLPLAIYGETMNGRTNITYLNGTLAKTVTANYDPGTSAGYVLGARWVSGAVTGTYLNGNIYEIIAFNSVLSTTNRQLVEGYLANKWGLKNSLPSTHPFKTISP